MSTVSPTAPFEGELIREPTPCGKCGYDLRGLRHGTRCPECGQPVVESTRRSEPASFGKPLVEAPDWYLRSLHIAFLMMTLSWLTAVVSMVLSWFGWRPLGFIPDAALDIGLAMLWAGGVLITLQPRPENVRGKKDGTPMREVPILRQLVALMQIPIVLAPVAFAFASNAAAPTGWVTVGFIMTTLGVGGYIPTALYFAQIAEWARDTNLAEKLRAYGWLVGIGLVGSLFVYAALELQSFLPILPFIVAPLWLLVFATLTISTILLTISTIRLMNMARWLLINRRSLLDRDARMIEKAQRQAEEMASRHPKAPPPQEYDQALYDSVIEKHDRSRDEAEEPTSPPKSVKFASEQRMEKTGENPYGLEEDES